MFLGLPSNVANGTNRIAILLQNVVGVSSFKQQKVLNVKLIQIIRKSIHDSGYLLFDPNLVSV